MGQGANIRATSGTIRIGAEVESRDRMSLRSLQPQLAPASRFVRWESNSIDIGSDVLVSANSSSCRTVRR